uniref:Epithelial cadherin n=1 Tax=Cyprinus carpio TaxID=7962 RepID=A0A8C1SSQ7_CYPCA
CGKWTSDDPFKQLLLWVEKQTWQVASPYSVDKRFDVNTDGTVMLKRQVTLHEGHKVFSVHGWDSSGEKHTVSVKVECIHHHKEHHMDRVMNISFPEVLTFSKSSTGAKRAKRDWVIPPFHVSENSRGPFPMKIGKIKSDFAEETQMVYSITGEGADQDPKGIFTVEKSSGNLFVTQPLNREKKASYRLIAHAVGQDVINLEESPMEILINVIDQNDNKPVFTHSWCILALNYYEFMTVTATDADDPETHNGVVYYTFVSQEPPFPKPNMFDINIVSGTIRVLKNEVGHVVTKLTVSDGDEVGSPAWSTKYRIISGDEGGFFNVSTGPSQLEGIITTVKPLDFEKTKQYVLSVIVENDDPFVGSLSTSTATVTVNVEDVNEPPEFNPKEKIIFKPEDTPVDTELVTYIATDPDTGKPQIKIMYKMGSDPAGWLSVSPETGVIKVRTLMDRESAYVKDGKYRATILAVDDDATSPATGTGTVIIELEDVNDNAPVINERNITVCNRGSAPVLLSVTDKDGPPHAAPFIVETRGETSKKWSTTMNETSGVFLHLKSQLEQGAYNVVLRVFDRHKLYQDSSIQATVCDCIGDEFQCTDKRLAEMSLSGVLRILGGILALLLLVCLLLLFLRRKSSTKKEPLHPEDDARDNICSDDEEGGGEDDNQVGFNLNKFISF